MNAISDRSYKNNVIGIVFIFQLIFISNENICMVLVLVNDNPITVCTLFFKQLLLYSCSHFEDEDL